MIVNKTHSLARASRTSAQLFSIALTSALIAIAAPATSSRAQTADAASPALAASGTDAAVQLAPYTVVASRTSEDISLIPTSVTSLALSEVQRMQIPDLRSALQFSPGVTISKTGGADGSSSSIFIRGAGSNQTLFLIDGIRMNTEDLSSSYSNFLGASGLAGLDRVEILRGPQSTLYGSAAMGGVIALESARGSGPASGLIALDGGSFNSIGATAAVAGNAPVTSALSRLPQALSYSASLAAAYAENDRDFNTFKQFNGSTRIEYQIAGIFTAGFTYRGLEARYEEPGPVDSPAQAGIIDTTVNIATLYAVCAPATIPFTSRLTLGWVQNQYAWSDAFGDNYPYHSTRNVIDWQNNWKPLDALELVAGLNTEWSLYNSSGATQSDRLASLYLNAVYTPVKNLDITAGIRGDNYDTLNTTRATWRAGAAYRIAPTNTTLRATVGTGFNAPAPQYVLGGGIYASNPDLKPEKSTGWDIGIEQDILHEKITAGVTYFHNNFTDKFDWDYTTYPYKTYNMPSATTQGVETYLYLRPIKPLHIQFAYTYLNTRDNTGERLPRQPRHNLNADINYQFTKQLLIGAGLTWVGGRLDKAYDEYYNAILQKMPDCTTVRVYGSYEVTKNLKLKLRVENLLDKKYDTIIGYPALPLGVFGSIEWRF